MLNERIIRDYSMVLYMEELNKTHNSKALFSQMDKRTSVLMIQLLDNKKNKQAMDLTGATVYAKVLKNDETTSTISCSVLDKEQGVIAIGLTEQCLVCLGQNLIELVVQDNTQQLYSPKISYTVTEGLYDENILISSQTEYPILLSLISSVQQLEKDFAVLNSSVTSNEEVRQANENKREQKMLEFNSNISDAIARVNEALSKLNSGAGGN